MKVIKIILWLILFIYLFPFLAFMTPLGSIGFVPTLVFYLAWVSISIYSGYRKLDDVLISAMIYSSFPFISYISPAQFQFAYGLFALWTFPFQSFFQGIPLTAIYVISFVQPVIFVTGYFTTRYISNCWEKKTEHI